MFQTENKILRKKEKRSHNVVCATDTCTGYPVAQEHEAQSENSLKEETSAQLT